VQISCTNGEAKGHFSTDIMSSQRQSVGVGTVDSLGHLGYIAAVHQLEKEETMEPEIIREMRLVAEAQQQYVTATDGLRRTGKKMPVSKEDADRILEVYRQLPEMTKIKFASYGYPMMLVVLPLLEKIGRSQ